MASLVTEPIAIIGSSCRFPGESDSPSKLWNLLHHPRDVLRPIPDTRFNPAAFYHPEGMHHGTTNVRESYLLSEDHRLFDAQFFNIKPVEAQSIDPQQRILLETVYESLESAGLRLEELRGSNTAVFVGLMNEEYSTHLWRDRNSIPTYLGTGTARSIMSNRISHFFDWHGPSMTIDTACSSSLVAIHQAVKSLRDGDSRVAVVGGANLILGPEMYIAESKLKMLSKSSRSRMWDAEADGYARGDGIAAIIMKTLSVALQDGDDIECIIRETGINQDGRTKGITVPSANAQAKLIRDTYAKAGLDLAKRQDRCQYFEAHGTGTPAGDPVEAQAINEAFYGAETEAFDADEVIFVGSIKTIIGHTEGTAGIAGILKASLALQRGIIPPNMLLTRINPAVEPFYKNLKIVSQAVPWPQIPVNEPRRASVNSFGFGGTNAHAILESYQPAKQEMGLVSDPATVFTPYIFSASSESSLAASLGHFSAHLKANQFVDALGLAYTLSSRRSNLPTRISISASNIQSLCSKIDEKLSRIGEKLENNLGTRPLPGSPRMLGIFTGQGAQWAPMGRDLILGSEFVRKTIEGLQHRLDELPLADRPPWSLMQELLAPASASRLDDSIVAQPLCTAIQIVLVDLLESAGIKFEAVVGHSSGEIGAAYAAGYLQRDDAIIIAYYRGLHSKLAGGLDGKNGAMMAVGTSFEDAIEICGLEDFEGRISVAASNSPSSVTLSGDADAIEEARFIFEDEKKFARVLKVNKAYHSHHVNPCSEPYMESIRASGIELQHPKDTTCSWFSSVYGGKLMHAADELKDIYWKENMLKPVLFSQAVTSAISEKGPFHIVLEVGPHAALKSPVLQILQATRGEALPYSGLLSRGKNDIEAFSGAMGYVWEHSAESPVNFSRLQICLSGGKEPRLIKNLPSYAWDHERIYWIDSRISKAFRTGGTPVHALLGTLCQQSTELEFRWRNLLMPKELPWLSGHQLQGQMVFPAAGYVATVLEGSKYLVGKHTIRVIEVEDLVISRPMTFNDEESGVEILFTITKSVPQHDDHDTISANFTYSASIGRDNDSMTPIATGRVLVVLGDVSINTLPSRSPDHPNMAEVDTELFYSSLVKLGYDYSGSFKALSSLKRRLNLGTALISNPQQDGSGVPLLVHPAMLDTAFQSAFLAISWPGDGSLQEIHVPTRIRRIRVNPSLCQSSTFNGTPLPVDVITSHTSSRTIFADLDIFSVDLHQNAIIQVEGMSMVPFAEATPLSDRQLFFQTIWDVALPDIEAIAENSRASDEDFELSCAAEQVALYYLKNLDEILTEDDRLNSEWYHKNLLDFATHTIAGVANGRQPFSRKEWMNVTRDKVVELMDKYPESVELQLVRAVGENLPRAIRGETNILEHMLHDNLLDRFYSQSAGIWPHLGFLAQTIKQLANRYPCMQVLEIGAGTGSATTRILQEIGQGFSSYTFTDISAGFFERAKNGLKENSARMIFKVLDVEKDVEAQGFVPHSYDVVVASVVLHATADLENTLKNARRLLRPGGFLLMLEMSNEIPIHIGFIFGSLPGWWLGHTSGRKLNPCVPASQWHSMLQNTGFSGVDTITPEVDLLARPFFVIASQAVDDAVNLLREPLTTPTLANKIGELIILSGKTLQTLRLADNVARHLKTRFERLIRVTSLEDLSHIDIPSSTIILNMVELDEPPFKSITAEKLDAMKRLFDQAKMILWITQGCRTVGPYSNMTVGFGRTAVLEMPHLRLQFLDIDPSERPDAKLIAETLLRLYLMDSFAKRGVDGDILWSIEPELALENGRLLIPRLLPDQRQNERLNSARRPITRDVVLQNTNVGISCSDTSISLNLATDLKPFHREQNTKQLLVQISHSLFTPIKISPAGPIFIVAGSILATGKKVIALSESCASVISVAESLTFDCTIPKEREGQFIISIASELIAEYVVSRVPGGTTLLLHEIEHWLVSALSRRATEKGMQVIFSTGRSDAVSGSYLYIHPLSSQRAVKRMIPDNVSLFVDLSKRSGLSTLGSRIASLLPSSCQIMHAGMIFSMEYPSPEPSSKFQVSKPATAFLSSLTTEMQDLVSTEYLSSVTVGRVSGIPMEERRSTTVNWTAEATVQIRIQPIDCNDLFAKNKTYLLFGLTSDLGQSLCQWMVEHGARYVVLVSRNPKVNKRWIEGLEDLGATIKIFPCDITDQIAVQMLCEIMSQTLPPIAGIANGSMVLHDSMIYDMTLEKMTKVLKPKVEGSTYLNELFQEKTLDFFVLFSSVASICGNSGQSNYSAANMFMTTLAAQRRSLGLAASVIHIGAVLGSGYLAREGSQAMLDGLQNSGLSLISEREFHQAFAEAVLAGQPHSGLNQEIIIGLLIPNRVDELKKSWFVNPKFGSCLIQRQTLDAKKYKSGSDLTPKIKLLQATSNQEVFEILRDSFISKLQAVLQIESDTTGNQTSMVERGADELGIDSLIAVELRSWFLKAFQVDVPVLKILGGATIQELLDFALQKLPKESTPNVVDSSLGLEADGELKLELKDISNSLEVERLSVSLNPTISRNSTAMWDQTVLRGLESEYSDLSTNSSAQSDVESVLEPACCEEIGDSTVESIGELSDSSMDHSLLKHTIERTEDMSFGQAAFWSQGFFIKDPTTLNTACSFRLKGKVWVAELERAVQIIGKRHESLRTCYFADENQQPRRSILETAVLHLESKKISSEEEAKQEFNNTMGHIYDIERGETVKIMLLSESFTSHFLIIGFHHIVMDGYSLEVLIQELEKVYSGKSLPPKVFQFSAFSAKQREDSMNGGMANELSFWRNEFSDIPAPLSLFPFSKTRFRRNIERYDFNMDDHRLGPSSELRLRIQQTCRKFKSTPFHFYLASFKALLFRFLGSNDMCIGIADANRVEVCSQDSIGLFFNLLPLRFKSQPQQAFEEALKEAKIKSYAALANSKVPFNLLMEELSVPRSATHSPFFQACVDYHQGTRENRPFGECQAQAMQYEVSKTPYDVSLDIIDVPEGDIILRIIVLDELYSRDDARTLMGSYLLLLEEFSKDPFATLAAPSLFSTADINRACKIGRGPTMHPEWAQTMSHQVDIVIQRHGNSVAVKDGMGNVLTYKQMDERSHTIAAALLSNNVTAGSLVAVFQEPESDWVCSLLAIMRLGATYVPLDMRIPTPRLSKIITDCQPHVILAHGATVKRSADLGAHKVKIIDVSSIGSSTGSTRNCASPEGIAVIFYTSGSTGVPKGIRLKHFGIVNEVEATSKQIQFGSDIVLQQSAVSFDMSLWQLFNGLGTGATVYIVPNSARGDPIALTKIIASEKITMTGACPSEYISWLTYGESELLRGSNWKVACSYGEQLTTNLKGLFRALAKPQLRLFNVYGPTEITFSGHMAQVPYGMDDRPFNCSDQDSILYTIQNYSTYIVDENLKLLPTGFPGEIVIGGAGVAAGYLSNEHLTVEKFIVDIFASPEYTSKGWTKMHRTGDRGRLRRDGALILEGRISGDTQIKLRGIRIDLKDVEATIIQTSNGALADAVVSVRKDPDFLVAHVVFSPKYPLGDQESLLEQLTTELPLPQYMCPALIIPLESLPLTSSSKVDRLALNSLPLPRSSKRVSDLMLTDTEYQLRSLWEFVLSRELFDIRMMDSNTDFFHTGGNSALLVHLQGLIRREFDVILPLVQLMEGSTIGSMSRNIDIAPPVSLIEWEKETSLSHSLLSKNMGSIRSCTTPRPGSGLSVLLTGSTGYLGKFLLRQLVADSRISIIHCVAIRPKSNSKARYAMGEPEKLVTYLGNLTEPLLGMPEVEFNNLASQVDVIIHNGAQRSFWEHYQMLRKANVSSTKELVKMALPRKIPIHFISSGGVFYLSGSDPVFNEISLGAFKPPLDGSNGYIASKWASEQYLENAAKELNIPVFIHRTTPSERTERNEMDTVLREILKYSIQIKALPSRISWIVGTDLISSETVSRSICETAISATLSTKDCPRFFHHRAEIRLTADDLFSYLETHRGDGDFEMVAITEWGRRLKLAGFGYLFASQNMVLGAGAGRGLRPVVSRR